MGGLLKTNKNITSPSPKIRRGQMIIEKKKLKLTSNIENIYTFVA